MNTLRCAQAALETNTGGTIRIVLSLSKGWTSTSCGSEELRDRMAEGWRIDGFYLSKEGVSVYAEVVGPCMGVTVAPGAALNLCWEADALGHFPSWRVLLPDGRYYNDDENDDEDENLWHSFLRLINKRRLDRRG